MADDPLDQMEDRMKRIRTGWAGEDEPEPGTPAFGERAARRRQNIRMSAIEEKPLSIQGRTKQVQFRKAEHEDILKKAGE